MDGRTVLRYRNFPIYIKLRKFRIEIIKILRNLPPAAFNLKNQGTRAVSSSCLAIAEGANKSTDQDFALYVNRSLTSLEEVISVLDLCFDDDFLEEVVYMRLLKNGDDICTDLLKFERSLRKKKSM